MRTQRFSMKPGDVAHIYVDQEEPGQWLSLGDWMVKEGLTYDEAMRLLDKGALKVRWTIKIAQIPGRVEVIITPYVKDE